MPIKLFLLRLVALVALAGSSASLVDHFSTVPAFCEFDGGCEDVTRSAYATLAGIPLGFFGIFGFSAILVSSFIASRSGWITLGCLSVLSGLGGLSLLMIQVVVLEQFCNLCVVIDLSAVALAVVYFSPLPDRLPIERSLHFWVWGGLASLFLAGPWLWAVLRPAPAPEQGPVPEQVKRHWVEGKVNVVVVTDFACPACRTTNEVLLEVLKDHEERTHLTIVACPREERRETWHSCRAFVAAEQQGKANEMAHELYREDNLDASSCRQIAADLGLDMQKYTKDVSQTDDKILETREWVRATGAKGLPLIWVQDQRLTGEQTANSLREAWTKAEATLTEEN